MRGLEERVDRVVDTVGVVEGVRVEVEHPTCRPTAERGGAVGERTYTYAQVDAESDRIAQWALDQRLAPGDGVALLCANRPEHLFCWLVHLDSTGHSLDTPAHSALTA